MRLHPSDDHVNCDLVPAALRDDDIRELLRGLDKGLVHRLDGGEVLVDDRIQRAAALLYIALDSPQDADIRVGIDENFDIHEIS